MAVSKLERLLNLINVLLDAPRPLRASELATRVPGYPPDEASFRRAFERDKDDLREMGVPLRLEDVPASNPPAQGYRIRQDEYYLRDPGLEPEELEALNLAAATVQLDGTLGRQALWKLGGEVGVSDGDGPGPAPTDLPTDPALVAAFQGVVERRTLRFTYRDVAREVNPYRLDFARGRWYLNGFDHGRGEERWYRLSRVQDQVVVGDRPRAFERPVEAVPGLQLDPWVLGGEGEEQAVRVRIDAELAPTVRAELDADHPVDEELDGSIVVTYRVTNLEGFRSYVLAFLEHAEVLDPPAARAAVVGWLEDLAGADG